MSLILPLVQHAWCIARVQCHQCLPSRGMRADEALTATRVGSPGSAVRRAAALSSAAATASLSSPARAAAGERHGVVRRGSTRRGDSSRAATLLALSSFSFCSLCSCFPGALLAGATAPTLSRLWLAAIGQVTGPDALRWCMKLPSCKRDFARHRVRCGPCHAI